MQLLYKFAGIDVGGSLSEGESTLIYVAYVGKAILNYLRQIVEA